MMATTAATESESHGRGNIIFALGTSAYVNWSGSFFATSLLAISTLPLSTLMQWRAVLQSWHILRDQQQAKRQHPDSQDGKKAEDASYCEQYRNAKANRKRRWLP
jgi:heme exporter protein D